MFLLPCFLMCSQFKNPNAIVFLLQEAVQVFVCKSLCPDEDTIQTHAYCVINQQDWSMVLRSANVNHAGVRGRGLHLFEITENLSHLQLSSSRFYLCCLLVFALYSGNGSPTHLDLISGPFLLFQIGL